MAAKVKLIVRRLYRCNRGGTWKCVGLLAFGTEIYAELKLIHGSPKFGGEFSTNEIGRIRRFRADTGVHVHGRASAFIAKEIRK